MIYVRLNLNLAGVRKHKITLGQIDDVLYVYVMATLVHGCPAIPTVKIGMDVKGGPVEMPLAGTVFQ